MSEVTQLIQQLESGDGRASEQLLPLVYNELRRLAQSRLKHAPGQTLQATALVHEAFVRLVHVPEPQSWDSRGHFFSAAAEAMRRILVESARKKSRVKHGGEFQRADITMSAIVDRIEDHNIEALDEALQKLNEEYPEHASLIKMRFFVGMSEKEVADVMGISRATASRYWTFGRTWLFNEMKKVS